MCSAAEYNKDAISPFTDGEIECILKHCSLVEQKNLKIVFERLPKDQGCISLQLTYVLQGCHMKIVLSTLRGRQHAAFWHKGVDMDQLFLPMEPCQCEHGAALLAQGQPGWCDWTTAGC